MSLPADGVNANALTETTTIPTGKKLIFLDPDTNEGGIITLENLTKQILSNLATQTFNLDQGTKTLLAALNELNSNQSTINTINISSEKLSNDCYIRKIGKIVWINYSSDVIFVEKGTWIKILDIPEDYRPLVTTFIFLRSSANNTTIRIMNTGEMQYYSDGEIKRQANFQFSGCYFTK